MDKQWEYTPVNMATDKYLGVLEFQDNAGEYHNFEVIQTAARLVFGGACNTGFLESGYMEMDDCFSIDENLQELLADLETFYNDGPGYCSRIICNERM